MAFRRISFALLICPSPLDFSHANTWLPTRTFIGIGRPRNLAFVGYPATHYHLRGETFGFYAEFLTPLVGSEYDRKHKRKAITEVAGASTQQLRHIELLLISPWSILVQHAELSARIRIANPTAFLAQKILIHRRRERQDRAKDIMYMRDTLEVFGARLPDLADLWRSDVAGHLQPRHTKMVSRASREMFGEVSDDIRRAA